MNAAADGIDALHVDTGCIVAIKPSGLLAVQGRGVPGADSLAARVQRRYPDALVVHRLDMSTSGLMLFARGAAAQRALNRTFAERRVAKRYVAIVAGRVAAPSGVIDLPLAADWPNRPRQKVDAVTGRPALTRWRVLAREAASGATVVGAVPDTTRLELEPVTGRSHQLRVHLAAVGHPIVGDALYAPTELRESAPRLLLHAAGLGFVHPQSGTPMTFESAAPF